MTDETAAEPVAEEFPDPGEVPVLDWIDKNLIDVEPLYQRPRDQARVEQITRNFNWRAFGALVVCPCEDGRYHITDGQHRLDGAKAHPKVENVPCVIVEAEDIPAEAAIFVEINGNRKNVTPLELFFAKLATGDEDALTVQQVCGRAGVRIPKYPSHGVRPGDCISVRAIQTLINRRGAMKARQYLEPLVKARLCPISANHIKAVEHLMTDAEFAGTVEPDDLTATILSMGGADMVEAKRFAATHNCTIWMGLASTWFQKTRKRRKAA